MDRLVRLHLLFFTALWPLLGAASIAHDLTIGELAALAGVALSFHVYAYVLNDVIDLPIDRTEPARQHDLLVSGAVRPSHALWLALAQPPLALALTTRLDARPGAYVTLAAAFALMGAYNLWGKRCPLPPATDAAQGLAWACLAIYATQALGAAPGVLTWMVAAYATVYIVWINGIHGGLRDLGNDRARSARTTAVFFGARPLPDGRGAYVPPAMQVYAWLILALLVALNAAFMLRNDFEYGRFTWVVTAAVVTTVNAVALLLQPHVMRPRGPSIDVAWRLQMYVVMLSLPAAFAARADAGASILLALLIALSLALFDTTAAVVRWMSFAWRPASAPAAGEALHARTPPID